MHFQTVFNTYKFTDFTTLLRFALPSVLQVKGNFVLILALASNNLSVCFYILVRKGSKKSVAVRRNNLAVFDFELELKRTYSLET